MTQSQRGEGKGEGGKNLPQMNAKALSIKVKFTIVVIFVCLISFGLAAFLSTQWMATEIEEHYQEKAELIWVHIVDDLENAMIWMHHEDILRTLNIYRNYKDVEEVRVFSLKGKEVFTHRKGPPEAAVEEVLRTGRELHFHQKRNNQRLMTSIVPIKNRPECHACHGSSEALRGVLLLTLNEEALWQYVEKQNQKFFILFGFIAAAVILVTIGVVNQLFLKPLSRVNKGTEAIAEGDLQYRIPLESKDEIGNLAKKFNAMAGTLQTLFGDLENRNIELMEQYRLNFRALEEWQEVFDSISDMICVVDYDFNIIKANKAFREYFSLPIGTVIKKCYEVVENCPQVDCPHPHHAAPRAVGQESLTKEFHDEKRGKIIQLTHFPHYCMEDKLMGFICILEDVTEKKETEIRLIMNERLAALGQMASGIAHEINNPLATISACAEGLLRRMESPIINVPLFKDYLTIIREETNRCKNITTSMLSFVRKKTPEEKEEHGIDINKIIDKTLDLIGFQERLKGIEIIKQYSKDEKGEGPFAQAKEGELRQVLSSIIINALDAMEGHGVLTLETGITPPTVFIRISDTGPGIPSHLLTKIFDPFFTTKSDKGGVGLGLSIAKKIIGENKGRINVTSEIGKGTTFTITLPV